MDKLKQIVLHNWLWLAIGLSCAVVLMVTLPALWSTHHVLFNLEPYPDALLYLASAKALVVEHTLQITQADWHFKTMVPPLYSLVLAVGWLIWPRPPVFYLVNVGLFLVATSFFTLTFRNLVLKPWLTIFGLSAWILHASVWWLAGLPMAEMLGLALTSIGIWAVVRQQLRWQYLVVATSVAWLLVLTKYVYVGMAGWLIVWSVGWTLVNRQWKWLSGLVFINLMGVILFGWYQHWLGINVFEIFGVLFPAKKSAEAAIKVASGPHPIAFYAFSYIPTNLRSYLLGLLGQPANLLWYQRAMTSGGLTLVGWFGWTLAMLTRPQRRMACLLSGAFLVQWPLLLVFITMDMRYAFLSIPLVITGSLLGLLRLNQKYPVASWGLAGVLLVTIFWANVPWYRTILADNLLHRSRAWQYEAVQELGRRFNQTETVVITALPPTLFNLYGFDDMKLLPLASVQEFAQKKMPAWGTAVNYQDLWAEYETRLAQGESVVVSNAYITHQAAVIEAFEALKTKYALQLVSDGCQQTCQIFILSATKSPP